MPILGKKRNPREYGKIEYVKKDGSIGNLLVNSSNSSTIHDSPIVKEYIRRMENRYQLPKEMLDSVMRQESYGAKPEDLKNKTSGAEGFAQTMPDTVKSLSKKSGKQYNPYDLEDSIEMSAKYLREALDRHKGSVKRALIDYNAGGSTASKYKDDKALPSETLNYVYGADPAKKHFTADWYKKHLSEKKSDLFDWSKDEDVKRKREDALITSMPNYLSPKIKDVYKHSRKPQQEESVIPEEEAALAEKPFGSPEDYSRADVALPEKQVASESTDQESLAPDIFKQNSAAIQKAIAPSRGPSSIDDFSTSDNYPGVPSALSPTAENTGSYTISNPAKVQQNQGMLSNYGTPVNPGPASNYGTVGGQNMMNNIPQDQVIQNQIPMEGKGQVPYYLNPNPGYIPASQDLPGAINQMTDFSGQMPAQPKVGMQYPANSGIAAPPEPVVQDQFEGPDQLPGTTSTQQGVAAQPQAAYESPFQGAFDLINEGTAQQYATAAASGMEQQKILNDFNRWQKEDPGLNALQKQKDNALSDADTSYQNYKSAVDDFKKIKAVDPNRFWKNMDDKKLFGTALSMFFGAVANKDGENIAIKLLDAAQEKDLQAQKYEFEKYGQHVELSNNIVAHAYKRLGNISDAVLAARRMKLEEVDMALKSAQAMAIAPQAKAGMLIAIGQNELKRAALDTEIQAKLAERSLKLDQIRNIAPFLRKKDVMKLMGGTKPETVTQDLSKAMTIDPISGKEVTLNTEDQQLMTKFTLGLEKSSQMMKAIDKLEPLVKSIPSTVFSSTINTDAGQQVETLVTNIQELYKSPEFANFGGALTPNEQEMLNKLTANPRSLTKDMLVSLKSLRQSLNMKIEAIREANIYGYKSPYSQLKKKSE